MQIYEQLLQFPLFQGMSSGDLQHVVEHTKFDFRKYKADSIVFRDGTICNYLHFLVHGKVETITASNDRKFKVTEEHEAPYLPQPERMFGRNQMFSSTMRAVTDINLVLISKNEVNTLTEHFLVFRINLINMLAYKTQKMQNRCWHPQPEALSQRITRYFADHCERPAGHKEFHITMNHLAQELNDSRLDISKALNTIQDKGLIRLYRGRIIIPALEKLI